MNNETPRRFGAIIGNLTGAQQGTGPAGPLRSYWCPGAIVGTDDKGFPVRRAAIAASDGTCANKTGVKMVPAGNGLVREVPQALCDECAQLEQRTRAWLKDNPKAAE